MALNSVDSGLAPSSVAAGRAGSVGTGAAGTTYAGGSPATAPPSLAYTPSSGAQGGGAPEPPYFASLTPQAKTFLTSTTEGASQLAVGGLDKLAGSANDPTSSAPYPALINPPPALPPPTSSNVGSYAAIGLGAVMVGGGIFAGGWWWLLAGAGAVLALNGAKNLVSGGG